MGSILHRHQVHQFLQAENTILPTFYEENFYKRPESSLELTNKGLCERCNTFSNQNDIRILPMCEFSLHLLKAVF